MGEGKRLVGVERRAARVLLLAVGENAQAVAAQVVTASRHWFTGEPPLVLVGTEAPASDLTTALAQACDALADQQRMTWLRRTGWTLARTNELQVWLLLDSADEEAGQAPQAAPSATMAVTLLERVTAIAWQRLRVHVVQSAFLLAEPAHLAALRQTATQLAAAGVEQIYITGPVNQEHVRFPVAHWQMQAAMALTILLWNTPPSHTALGQHTSRVPEANAHAAPELEVTAIGGAAWLSPLPALQEWLAIRTAQAVIQLLQQDERHRGTGQDLGSRVTTMTERTETLAASYLAQAEAELAALAPRVAPINGWRSERPAWSALATLAKRLLAEAAAQQERQQIEQQQMRRRWLTARMESWERAQQANRQTQLLPAQGWPALPLYQTDLTQQAAAIQAMTVVIEAQLEKLGTRLAQIEQQVQQRVHALKQLCHYLPAYTPKGVLMALVQPWRWLDYGYAYWARLPVLRQQCLDAVAERQVVACQEANWHSLRQVYLAMAQDVRRDLQWSSALQARLAEVTEQLQQRAAQVALAALAPWQPAALQQLWTQQLGDSGVGAQLPAGANLAALFQQMPLVQWLEQDADSLTQALLTWAGTLSPPCRHWSAIECLTQGLGSRGVAVGEVTASATLADWLEQFVHNALPLWPTEEAVGEVTAESWLLTAPLATGNDDDANGVDVAVQSRAALEAWCATQPDLFWASSAVDGLLALQWTQVAISRWENEE